MMRLLARLPILLYRARLGITLGERFLLLKHVGRNTGRPRNVVLEVVQRTPEAGIYYVASGWGERSNWYQNAKKQPLVTVQVKNRTWRALAERLPPAGAENVFLDYARRHPRTFRFLARFMGYQLSSGDVNLQAMATEIPVIALSPLPQASEHAHQRNVVR